VESEKQKRNAGRVHPFKMFGNKRCIENSYREIRGVQISLKKAQRKNVTKEATSSEAVILLVGLLPRAELALPALPPELLWVPELSTEDKDKDETEDEWTGVVEGGVPGTEVGWAGGLEVVDGGRSTVPELDDPPVDPPVMVKVGEALPESPITKLDRQPTERGGRGVMRLLTHRR